MTIFQDETIWIVGASSGIGRSLAVALAADGAKLILSARRSSELEVLNRELGGRHLVLPFDVGERSAADRMIETINNEALVIDRAIFLPALYEPQTIEKLDIEFAEKLLRVNVLGCFAFAKALMTYYKKLQHRDRKRQLAICGSIAAYMGLPNGQPYSASKAAVQNFTESLYAEAPSYIDVKLISPGFVRTRITDKNDYIMPFIMSVEEAAMRIKKGLLSNRFEIHFPKRLTWQLKLLTFLPYKLSLIITKHIS